MSDKVPVKGLYQRQKNNKYILPAAVYNKTIWQIRDYYRLKEAQDSIIYQRGSSDGTPRGSGVGDPTFYKAEKLARALDIWDSIQFRSPYPIDADRSTYGRLKSRFVYTVAKKLDYIDD